ncbi:hypothetical protein CPB86DRAFT_813377 [Serendipita vermifera]|nr:hypothetical protein CPB86DRAFT_813377 [Serendipita vermifera]
MSAFTEHRTIIASLFLPTSTAAAFHPNTRPLTSTAPDASSELKNVDNPASRRVQPDLVTPSATKSPTTPKFSQQRPGHARQPSSLSLPKAAPPSSIIEELLSAQVNRGIDGGATSPKKETSNPFATFATSGNKLENIKEYRPPNVPRSISQAVSSSSSDSEDDRRSRPSTEISDKRNDHDELHENQGRPRGTPVYRRLSRKKSRGSESLKLTRDVSVGPWEIETNPNANGGLHNAVKSVEFEMKAGKLWVGVLGPETDDIPQQMRVEIEERMRASDSVPVWVNDSDFSGCYDDFCHQVLWPSLHYIIPDAPKAKVMYESSSFVQYKAVNEAFAEKIASIWEEGDVIWINDYHLMLLPQLLRIRLPKAAIGFFLHVAFPSSEIFRCLAARESLLHGMLGADLVGFQTHSYARHFRQTVSRILSVEATPKGIQVLSGQNLPQEQSPFSPIDGIESIVTRMKVKGSLPHGHPMTDLEKAKEEIDRTTGITASEHSFVDVAVFPMGIDVQSLTRKRKDTAVDEWVRALRERYPGMKMIVARDKLDEVQGVRQKFLAFERFLEQNKEFQGKVMLIQVALSTTSINELQGNVTDVISRINMKFSTLTYQPIIFFHTHDITFSQYLALLTVADCFIVTSMREGMALRAHEFVECQAERKRPLILSEFTGSFSFSGFRSCLAINPWDIQMTADAILQSLTMSDEEAATRWIDLHTHVNTQTAQAFTTSFLNRTIRVNYKHHLKASLSIPHLDTKTVRDRYQGLKTPGSKRLILIDLERTLWPQDASPDSQVNELSEQAMKLLGRLIADSHNEVWALSGLAVKGKLETIADRLPGLGICAEHGCFIKPRGESTWVNMVQNVNQSWMAPCMEILQYFTERTPFSFVDKREATIVWRFAATDDEGARSWARRQAAEAQNHIYDSLGERFRLRIIPSLSSFIVLPKAVGRTTAVASILNSTGLSTVNVEKISNVPWPTPEMGNIDNYEYILAVGGDDSLMNRLKRIEKAETVYTGLRKSGGSKWRCEPEHIYEAIDFIIRD